MGKQSHHIMSVVADKRTAGRFNPNFPETRSNFNFGFEPTDSPRKGIIINTNAGLELADNKPELFKHLQDAGIPLAEFFPFTGGGALPLEYAKLVDEFSNGTYHNAKGTTDFGDIGGLLKLIGDQRYGEAFVVNGETTATALCAPCVNELYLPENKIIPNREEVMGILHSTMELLHIYGIDVSRIEFETHEGEGVVIRDVVTEYAPGLGKEYRKILRALDADQSGLAIRNIFEV